MIFKTIVQSTAATWKKKDKGQKVKGRNEAEEMKGRKSAFFARSHLLKMEA